MSKRTKLIFALYIATFIPIVLLWIGCMRCAAVGADTSLISSLGSGKQYGHIGFKDAYRYIVCWCLLIPPVWPGLLGVQLLSANIIMSDDAPLGDKCQKVALGVFAFVLVSAIF